MRFTRICTNVFKVLVELQSLILSGRVFHRSGAFTEKAFCPNEAGGSIDFYWTSICKIAALIHLIFYKSTQIRNHLTFIKLHSKLSFEWRHWSLTWLCPKVTNSVLWLIQDSLIDMLFFIYLNSVGFWQVTVTNGCDRTK